MQQAQHPIFREYGERLGELARLTGWAEATLMLYRDGKRIPSEFFRLKAAKVLGRSEAELFNEKA